jgi:hypothetical protein
MQYQYDLRYLESAHGGVILPLPGIKVVGLGLELKHTLTHTHMQYLYDLRYLEPAHGGVILPLPGLKVVGLGLQLLQLGEEVALYDLLHLIHVLVLLQHLHLLPPDLIY